MHDGDPNALPELAEIKAVIVAGHGEAAPETHSGGAAEDVATPVDTVADEVAHDFGYVRQLYDPDEGRMRMA